MQFFQVLAAIECINFFKNEGQKLLSESIFGFKASLFLLFELRNRSAVETPYDS
jgi:hypothetical protein